MSTPAKQPESLANQVYAWPLAASASTPGTESLRIGARADTGNETAPIDDNCKLVDPNDIKKGGKYYSIVKLQIRYEGQSANDTRWAQRSGWLIQPDLLVTAGHCAYDHAWGLGKAIEVKAYVGYNGKDSVQSSPDVQFRCGDRILTTFGWVENEVNRQNDVSFVKLEKPFTDVVPFTFQATPIRGRMVIGVVGYPADKQFQNETAAQMYEEFHQTVFDLTISAFHMLTYPISTFGEQSGSPVLIQGKQVSIGTHVYGNGFMGAASVIRGQYGNYYVSYRDAIAQPPPTDGKPITVPSACAEDAFPVPSRSDAEDF